VGSSAALEDIVRMQRPVRFRSRHRYHSLQRGSTDLREEEIPVCQYHVGFGPFRIEEDGLFQERHGARGRVPAILNFVVTFSRFINMARTGSKKSSDALHSFSHFLSK
jgi:hypothetical protein